MAEDRNHLWGWQRELEDRLRHIELVQELDLGKQDLDTLIPLVQAFSRECPDALNFARTFPGRFPAVFIVLLVLTGVHRFHDANFWERIREIFPELSENHLQLWREEWKSALRRYGLSAFAHVPAGHRTLMPIQLHGGLAQDHLEPFFRHLVWPAVTHPQWAGTTARELLDDLPRRPSLRQVLPKAVSRFLEHGGQLAERFLDRCLAFTAGLADGDDGPGQDETRLPGYVVASFRQLASGDANSTRVRRTGLALYRRPRLQFEPAGTGIHLRLPVQRLAAGVAGRVTWVVGLDGRSVVIPVTVMPGPDGPLTDEAHVALTGPTRQMTVHLSVDGQDVRSWELAVLQGGVLFFSAVTGEAIERSLLPSGAIWVVAPSGSTFEVQQTEQKQATPPLCRASLEGDDLGWPGYEAHQLELSGPGNLEIRSKADDPKSSIVRAIEDPTGLRVESVAQPDEALHKAGPSWALIGMEGASPRIVFQEEPLKLSLPGLAGSPGACLLVELGHEALETTLPVLRLVDRHGHVLQVGVARTLPPGFQVKASRVRFPLAALRSTLEASQESQLVLELTVTFAQGKSRSWSVMVLRQAWEPRILAAEWHEGKLVLQWEERHAIEDRHLWIWDLWRPWTEPTRQAIAPSARGQAVLDWPGGLAPGAYRGQLGVLDWTSGFEPERPERGAEATFELLVGSPGERGEHLAGLGGGPLDRATQFMASGYEGVASFPQLYHLESQTGAEHVWPMVLTVMGRLDAPDAARKAWLEKVGYVACEIRAWDTARSLIAWSAQVSEQRRREAIEALVRLGWLRTVGPGWKPVEFKNAEREICEVVCSPLEDASIRRLWELWPPLGSGVEPSLSGPLSDSRDRLASVLDPGILDALEALRSGDPVMPTLNRLVGDSQDPDMVAMVLAKGPAMLFHLAESLGGQAEHVLDERTLPATMHRLMQRSLEDPSLRRDLEDRISTLFPQMQRHLEKLESRGGAAAMLATAMKRRQPRLFKRARPGEALAGLPAICGGTALLCRLKANAYPGDRLPPAPELDELAVWMLATVPELFAHDLVLVDRALAALDASRVGGLHAPVV